jgi:hypothetical protein
MIEIGFILDNFQFAKISAQALKKLRLEISISEAKFYKINEGDVSILTDLGVINSDLNNLSKVELIYSSNTIGTKLFASHASNLLVIQKPIIVKGKLISTVFYYFRVFNGKPVLFREDIVHTEQYKKRIEKHLIVPSDILSNK